MLDDATSAIDASTEEEIHTGLRTVLAGRTTVLIAHRVSTLHLADRVVLLENGRVSAEGTHDDLLAGNPAYRELLSGLDAAAVAALGDSVEAYAAISSSTTTPEAWRAEESTGIAGAGAALVQRAPSLGPGLGGGGGGGRGGGGNWRINLAPTPELLARVAALPPVRDEPRVDLARETGVQQGFSLWQLTREFRRPLAVGLILVVVDAIAGLLGPVLVRTGIDDGVAKGALGVLLVAAGAFLLVTLVDLIDEIGETFVMGRAAEQIMLSLRIRVWAQLQRLSMDYYEREMAGRIMTRMTTDIDQFESLIENGLLAALVAFVTFFGVGVALVVIDPPLGLCTLTVVIPLAIATVLFRQRAARLYDQARERIAIVNADFQEGLSGVREAQVFVHEARTRAHFHSLGAAYLRSRVEAQRLVATYFPFVQFLSAVADAIVLGVGAYLIAHHDLTTGALIAFLLYIDMFFSPVQQLSQVFDSWQQTRISVNRIDELMHLHSLTPEAADPMEPGRLHGDLALRHVRFSYPVAAPRPGRERRGPADAHLPGADGVLAPPPEALKQVDLHVTPGETVALVGETGAGKSTVLKLIARFYDPASGSVQVDDHDVRSLDLHAFRTQLGYVPQEAFLFTGTIRDNIAYGRPDASDAEVEAAARAVGAHDFVAGLPGGYLHQVAERGRSLSAGQRQLLALARAELVDPALLLLDEATSNLDLATEAHVTAAMHRVAHDRTTILIAHRLQTAREADRIVVLDRGTVAESGSHDELLANGGRYAAMWRSFESIGAGRVAR